MGLRLVHLPKEEQDGTRRCPSLQTQGCLSTPSQVHRLLVKNGQAGFDFGSFSVWPGSTPPTASGGHQLAICIRDTVLVLSATEQTQKRIGGKDPTSPTAAERR